jgi:hypothetical protein
MKTQNLMVLVACLALLIWGFISIGKTVLIRYTGVKVIAVVTKVPTECDKYNNINVLLNTDEYQVNISKTDCRQGVYKIGQNVTLIKHKKYNELVWPDSRPELTILIIIGVLIFGYVTTRKYYRK